MAELQVDLIPNFDELEGELEDEEVTKQVVVDTPGAGGGGVQEGGGDGGGGGGLLATLGAEAGTDIASGAGKGGALGRLAGGVSAIVSVLGAILGVLLLLEPIQEALGFLVRQLELLVVPLVSALRPVLEVVQKAVIRLIQFLRNPDEFLTGLVNSLRNVLAPIVNSFIDAVNQTVPGVQLDPVSGAQGQTLRETGEFDQVSQNPRAGETQSSIARGATEAAITAVLPALAPASSSVAGFLLSDDASQERLKQQASSGSNLSGGRGK